MVNKTRPDTHRNTSPLTVHDLAVSRDETTGLFSLVMKGRCPLCATSFDLPLGKAHGNATLPCPQCQAQLRVPGSDIKRLGRGLLDTHMSALERELEPWPEITQTKSSAISNFNSQSTAQAYLQDRPLTKRAEDELVLLMALVADLKPWLHVRFGLMQSAYFGHMTMNTQNYLSERRQGVTPSDTLDFFGYAGCRLQ